MVIAMRKVSAQYIAGIKEGRLMLDWWQRELVEENIASLVQLRARLAPLANTETEIEFFDGQLDFLRNQLANMLRSQR